VSDTGRSDSDLAALTAALARVPLLAGADPASAVRLAGLTNVNYRVGEWVVRIPGKGTSEFIDRTTEEVAARSAADAGVNVEVRFFDATDGLMVTRFAEGATTMHVESFRDLGSVHRAGEALRRLHSTAAPFAGEFRLWDMIDEYKQLITAKHAPLPDGYDEVLQCAGEARAALQARPALLAPCHCDPLCENFLDDGTRMWLIDYEYAGNNDPMWDLGDLSVEGCFDTRQDDALLAGYFAGRPPAEERARMVVYKAMCDLLWTLWGVIQHANGNPADDFWAYAVGRFQRCRQLMATDEYAEAMMVLRGR
jgi:thiamine kinase-like enzyme